MDKNLVIVVERKRLHPPFPAVYFQYFYTGEAGEEVADFKNLLNISKSFNSKNPEYYCKKGNRRVVGGRRFVFLGSDHNFLPFVHCEK
jgi:hypothetical protein